MKFYKIALVMVVLLSAPLASSAEKKDEYDQQETQAITYFESFLRKISSIKSGGKSKIGRLTPAAVQYLSGAYFYCALRNGDCNFLLDAVLEADIARAQVEKLNECPSMTAFWRAWIDNNFEQRMNRKTHYWKVLPLPAF